MSTKKEKQRKEKDRTEETDVLDAMITSLAEPLEEKGLIIQEKWEQEIKKRLKT